MNSDKRREIKKVVQEQEASGYERCWFGNLKSEGRTVDIEITEELVKGKRKSKWKKEVKSKIKIAVEKKMEEKKQQSKKMRFLGKKGCETYLNEVFNDDARLALKIRLNMVEWVAGNVGKRESCPVCEVEEDTTEHVLLCELIENGNVSIKDLEEGKAMAEIVKLFRRTEEKRKELLTTKITTNIELLHREGTL